MALSVHQILSPRALVNRRATSKYQSEISSQPPKIPFQSFPMAESLSNVIFSSETISSWFVICITAHSNIWIKCKYMYFRILLFDEMRFQK